MKTVSKPAIVFLPPFGSVGRTGHTKILGTRGYLGTNLGAHDYASEKISFKNGLFSSVFMRIGAGDQDEL
jgi:hypothetical protein